MRQHLDETVRILEALNVEAIERMPPRRSRLSGIGAAGCSFWASAEVPATVRMPSTTFESWPASKPTRPLTMYPSSRLEPTTKAGTASSSAGFQAVAFALTTA